MLWHGSSKGGRRHLQSFCEAWRERSAGGAASTLLSRSLLQQSSSSCSAALVVLCIENSYVGGAT